MVEVAVDKPVEEMPDVEPSLPPHGVRVTINVDGAAVGQQIIELRPIGEFIDSRQIDKQQPPRVGGRGMVTTVGQLCCAVGGHNFPTDSRMSTDGYDFGNRAGVRTVDALSEGLLQRTVGG